MAVVDEYSYYSIYPYHKEMFLFSIELQMYGFTSLKGVGILVLENLGRSLHEALRKLLRAPLVDEKVVKELIRDIQRSLLQADVNVELVLKLSKNIERRALSEEVPPGISRREYIVQIVYDELTKFLGKTPTPPRITPGKTNVIMLVGIQGSGKTTSAAKLARYFQKKGLKVALVCADTFRPGAFEQLSQLAQQIGVPIYGEPKGKNPVKIAKNGIKRFSAEKYEVVIVDTAGRHKEEEGLMKEMKSLAEAIKPDEIILVIDGTIGQQAASQARAFHEATPIGSIFVTKLDSSARGGGALSAVAETGAPIKFIGTGEKLDDIELFDPPRFVGRLLGMGDIRGLLEKIREAKIVPERDVVKSFMTGKFTLKDMYYQLESVRKMGPLKKIWEFLGLGYKLPDEVKEVAEEKLDKWKVILQSMTREELENPKIINRSRMVRIARGSGTATRDVKELVDQYFMFKKVFKQMIRRRVPRIHKFPGVETLRRK